MHNPVTATHDPVQRGITAPPTISACDSGPPRPARFAPLFTRAIRLAITTVTDELGRAAARRVRARRRAALARREPIALRRQARDQRGQRRVP